MTMVLLIDDDERLAKPLTEYFERFGLSLISATHPTAGLELLASQPVDLVILDVMLPDQDGFQLCRQIRRNSNIPIVMLSARGDVNDRLVGLELGADDYVAKPFEPRELVVRIQNILRRNDTPAQTGTQLRFKDLVIDRSQLQVTVGDKIINLTSNEYQLLVMLASSPGRSFSREDIFNFLRGTEVEMISRAIDIQISRLRNKLRPTDYIKTMRGAGYCFIAPEAELTTD